MVDGDVALHGEGRQGQGRGVDAQVLHVDHQGASGRAPDPLVAQDVVAEDLLRDRGDQGDGVSHGQADQVAVGGGMHGASAPHHRAHQHVAQNASDEDDAL